MIRIHRSPWIRIGFVAALLLSAAGSVVLAGHGQTLGFDVIAEGDRLDLLLTVRRGEDISLEHQHSSDGGETWTVGGSVPLGSHPIHPPSPGSEPQIVSEGEKLLVMWTTPGTSRWGGGPLVAALSTDSGKTWTATPSPASTGSTDAHGEVDLLVDGGGNVRVVWLDNRDKKRGLRAALSRDFGRSWQQEETIDPTTCACCWNRLLPAPEASSDQVYVIYRDAEPRDLAVARSKEAGWQVLERPAIFDWSFTGCPSVGGALAWTETSGGFWLHALTWTGQEGKNGLYLSRSKDRGASWEAPIQLGDKRSHRGDLAARGSVTVAVWDAFVESRKGLFIATSSDHGSTWSSPKPFPEAVSRGAQPRVVALKDGFRIFWLDTEASTGWRSARYKPTRYDAISGSDRQGE